jgi:hypothetical protein
MGCWQPALRKKKKKKGCLINGLNDLFLSVRFFQLEAEAEAEAESNMRI